MKLWGRWQLRAGKHQTAPATTSRAALQWSVVTKATLCAWRNLSRKGLCTVCLFVGQRASWNIQLWPLWVGEEGPTMVLCFSCKQTSSRPS